MTEALLDFIIDVAGKDRMGDVFLGYWQEDIWHGNETLVHHDLRHIYHVGEDQ